MTLVQQITPFTCGLACIESLTRDFNVGITQCEMLVKYKGLLLGEVSRLEDFGAITSLKVAEILEDRGLNGVLYTSENLAGLIEALLNCPQGIIWHEIKMEDNKNKNHFFRLSDYNKNSNQVFVMNPQFDLPAAKTGWVDLSDFLSGNSHFLLLSHPTT